MPEISVIVPVYNTEKYLRRCVDSILAQTFTDFELILVDDGSSDNCPTICDEYAQKDSRIQVIHQANQGQAAARNHAIAQANGEWACFVDSDDMIHPQMLELLYAAVIGSNAQISMCSVVEGEVLPHDFLNRKEAGFSVHDVDEDFICDLYGCDEYRCWVVCGKLIRREIVRNIPFEAGRIYEDNAVVCQWLYEAKTVANIQERLYFYMINPSGTTKSQFTLKKLDYLWALEEKIQFYKKVGYAKLRERFCAAYMTTAVNYRWKVLDLLHRRDIADEIGRHMRKVYRQNLSFVKLSADYRVYAYGAMFPHIMRLYFLAQAGIKTLRHDGLFGLANKIKRYLHRGENK